MSRLVLGSTQSGFEPRQQWTGDFFTCLYPDWPWDPLNLGLSPGSRRVEIYLIWGFNPRQQWGGDFIHSFMSRLALGFTQSGFNLWRQKGGDFSLVHVQIGPGIHSIWVWSQAAEGWRFFHSFVSRLALGSTQSGFDPDGGRVEIFLHSYCPDWPWDQLNLALIPEGWRFSSLVCAQIGPGVHSTS